MTNKKLIYLIGSLRNSIIPEIGVSLRNEGFQVFDDWFAPGPEADDFWLKYSKIRGHSYKEALEGWAAKHVFEFDKFHIDRSDVGLLVNPAGKSGHLEFGYMLGQGKPGYIYFSEGEPERWDVMYQFATGIVFDFEELKTLLKKDLK